MDIRLYDTRTRQKRALEPVAAPGRVSMYVCGPTVYDRAHIGNARPVVVFDVLFRLLRHVYGAENVKYVRNITDVDDKIIARAREAGRPIEAITEETTRWFHEDMAALGALPPTEEPRATGHIGEMIAMIALLIERGHAYAAEGHVLFSVASYPDYGRLARRSLADMRGGARVEVAPYKRDAMDFVLWKPSDAAIPGWDSPWGRGRPGWHIECSAMARALLGGTFDIHGGGVDLAFPHHENELAQSACAHPDEGFARIWMHNGMLNVEGEKMSKSLGNFFTVRDLLDRGVPGEVIRFVLLSTHYRQPIDWTEAKVHDATVLLTLWEKLLRDARSAELAADPATGPAPEVLAALADDLNTPLALKVMRDLASEVRLGGFRAQRARGEFEAGLALMGINPEGFRSGAIQSALERAFGRSGQFASRVAALLGEREQARKASEFARADAIRDGLVAAGIQVMDRPGGATDWELGPDFDPAQLERIVR